jgi:GT2 family glycosyltransferase
MPITVSVITPSYNQAQYLEETLRSVICQRDQVHEYFVLDGGSTDQSAELIRKYSSSIDYWVSEKDKGQSDAIAKGFARATGDVLGWLNSDDAYFPGTIARVREAFERHPEWDVITSDYAVMDGQTRITGMYRRPRQSPWLARQGHWLICQQGCFFRRSLYERAGGLDVNLHCLMDADLWCKFFRLGAAWGHVHEYLAGFRMHPQSKTASWAATWEREGRAFCEKYTDLITSPRKHRLWHLLYLAGQLFSGRQLRAAVDTWRWRGKTLEEVFGSWRCAATSDEPPRKGQPLAAATVGGAA